jgi:hypothetical protein
MVVADLWIFKACLLTSKSNVRPFAASGYPR